MLNKYSINKDLIEYIISFVVFKWDGYPHNLGSAIPTFCIRREN